MRHDTGGGGGGSGSGSRQTIRLLKLSFVGLPFRSSAGEKPARSMSSRQAAESRAAEPLEAVTAQLATRPSLPTSTRKPTAPSSPDRIAEAG